MIHECLNFRVSNGSLNSEAIRNEGTFAFPLALRSNFDGKSIHSQHQPMSRISHMCIVGDGNLKLYRTMTRLLSLNGRGEVHSGKGASYLFSKSARESAFRTLLLGHESSNVTHCPQSLPMLLSNSHRIHIHSVLEPSILALQSDLITTHLSLPHLPLRIKGPVFKAITPPPHFLPLLRLFGVSILVPELHCNLVLLPREKLLPQAIVELMLPFLRQESNDLFVASEEEVAVAPDGVLGVSGRNPMRVSISLD